MDFVKDNSTKVDIKKELSLVSFIKLILMKDEIFQKLFLFLAFAAC